MTDAGNRHVEALVGEGTGPVGTALDDVAIAAHNAEVARGRAHFDPLIAAITDEQARMVIDLAQVRGRSMNRIAIEMRPYLDWEIPDDKVIAVGWDLYLTALRRFDLYDADFRPRPERVPFCEVDGVQVFYTTDTRLLDFEVHGRRHTLRTTHTVRFGLDVTDAARLNEAVAMAKADGPDGR